MINQFEGFEKAQAIRGHAEVLVSIINPDGLTKIKIELMKQTIERMLELATECIEIAK